MPPRNSSTMITPAQIPAWKMSPMTWHPAELTPTTTRSMTRTAVAAGIGFIRNSQLGRRANAGRDARHVPRGNEARVLASATQRLHGQVQWRGSCRPDARLIRRPPHLRTVRGHVAAVLRRALPARAWHHARPDPRRAQRRLHGRRLRPRQRQAGRVRGAERGWSDISAARSGRGQRVQFAGPRHHLRRAGAGARPLSAHRARSGSALSSAHQVEHRVRSRRAGAAGLPHRLPLHDHRTPWRRPHRAAL